MKSSNQITKLLQTQEFWDTHPCDAQDSFFAVRDFRFKKDLWLKAFLKRIAHDHPDIVEIGCGQGTDGIYLCGHLPVYGSFIGIDYSSKSCPRARIRAGEVATSLRVPPKFRTGNAEALDFSSNSLKCVYSLGVLHHSPDTIKAVQEVFRVLKPGGTAYICLYNTWSPKVFGAHILRGIQLVVDKITGGHRVIYRALNQSRFANSYGTMVQECFGTPILRSFTKAGMRQLFSDFEIVTLRAYGSALPFVNEKNNSLLSQSMGFLWVIQVRKPN